MKSHLSYPAELVVYFGPMFSGKTSSLIEDIVRAEIAGLKSQIFKPGIDNRGEGKMLVKSKGGSQFKAIPIRKSSEIIKLVDKDVLVVGIDEVQFIDEGILDVISHLTHKLGIRVVIAGLPTDFRGEPFGVMPTLMAKADRLVQTFAVCMYREKNSKLPCGNNASRTQRLINGEPANWEEPVVKVGGSESYQPRCRSHHFVPGRPERH